MPDYVLGVDLNDYRKGVPLRQVKRQGGRFVLNKATEGLSLVHETNEIYRAEAESLGMPFGNYLYWRYAYDAKGQADFYLEHMGKIQFRPIVDVERINNRKSDGSPLLSVNANIAHLHSVLNRIEEGCSVRPMIYTNWATWNEQFGNSTQFVNYPLWVANYGRNTPLLPVPWQPDKWEIWQWTSSYTVEGYARGIDANYFNGNEGQFEEYIAEIDKLWNPAPPEPEPVTIVTLSILRANGNETLEVLGVGDSVTVKVEEF